MIASNYIWGSSHFFLWVFWEGGRLEGIRPSQTKNSSD
jgi:hypothetical protein